MTIFVTENDRMAIHTVCACEHGKIITQAGFKKRGENSGKNEKV